jgi:hypothetical protein
MRPDFIMTETRVRRVVHFKKRTPKALRTGGTPVIVKQIGRNDTCPCGSGLKYKHCCGSSRSIANLDENNWMMIVNLATYARDLGILRADESVAE